MAVNNKIKEISIIIDAWDELFSDFDPRPLDERALSEDFIRELKERYLETRKGDFVISFYAPVGIRDEKTEKTVTHRIKQHFKFKALHTKKEIIAIRVKGIIFVIMGFVFLSFLMFAAYYKFFSELVGKILDIIFTPLGWFGIWEGFSKVVDASPIFSQEETLYRKLSKAEYKFNYGS